jgi:hypothetical protein
MKSFRKKMLIATMVAGSIGVSTGEVAQATSWDSCTSGNACMFDNSNGGGGWVFNGVTSYVGDSYNDRASSFRNRSAGNKRWMYNTSCGGSTAMVLSPGNQQNASWWNNDETSSVCTG